MKTGKASARSCPKCGQDSVVYDTREDPRDGRIIRRRKCPGCGFRFITNEFYIKPVGRTTEKPAGGAAEWLKL